MLQAQGLNGAECGPVPLAYDARGAQVHRMVLTCHGGCPDKLLSVCTVRTQDGEFAALLQWENIHRKTGF